MNNLSVNTYKWEDYIVSDYMAEHKLDLKQSEISGLRESAQKLIKLYINLAFEDDVNTSLLSYFSSAKICGYNLKLVLLILEEAPLVSLFEDKYNRQHILDTLYVGLKATALST